MFGDSDFVELIGFRSGLGALLVLEIAVDLLDPIAAALEVVIGELASVGRARWRVMIRTTAQEGQRRAEGQRVRFGKLHPRADLSDSVGCYDQRWAEFRRPGQS